jgi:exosortase family protein XrtF
MKKSKLKIIEVYQKQNPLLQFVINGFLLVILWLIFYHFVRYLPIIDPIYELITKKLSIFVLFLSKHALMFLGFDVSINGTIIYIEGAEKSVNLLRGCLGRNLMGIFAGFIIAFPGEWKKKLWYVPLGVAVILLVNVVRIVGLAYNSYCCPDNMKFNHDTFFNYSIYILTFLLWVIWVKKFSPLRKKTIK